MKFLLRLAIRLSYYPARGSYYFIRFAAWLNRNLLHINVWSQKTYWEKYGRKIVLTDGVTELSEEDHQ